MNSFAIMLTASMSPAAAGLDGDWMLLRLELNGHVVNVGHPVLAVRARRLIFEAQGDMPAIALELGLENRVFQWDPGPVSPPQIVCPFTPRQWAKRFGDPIYSPWPQQWVIDPTSGQARIVPPMPCQVLLPPPPMPLGVFVLAKDRLAIQLQLPDTTAPSLLLVLEKTLPQPQELR